MSLTLYAEHEFNASTFTGRVCASTSRPSLCLTAAVGSLRGPLHGGANEEAMKMLQQINSVEEVKGFVDQKFENKKKLWALATQFIQSKIQEATSLRNFLSSFLLVMNTNCCMMQLQMEAYMWERKKLFPNTDFFMAPAYHYIGIPMIYLHHFRISSNCRLGAHAFEQRSNNRIIRPSAEYIGPEDRNWLILNQGNV